MAKKPEKKKDLKPEEKEEKSLPMKEKPEAQPQAEKSKNLAEELYIGLAEQSYAASSYVPASQMRPYNPDDLYQKRNDYGIYEEMMQDDQVSICMKLKKDMVLASGWDIVTEGEEDQDTEVKEFLEAALKEQTEGTFDDMLEEVLSAYEFGFSLSEKVFQKKEDGMLGLKYLRTRHPATWLIHTDDRGIIERYEQRSEKASVDIEPKALIHYINQPRFQNPYGLSDLRSAYNAWFVKRQIIRYFAVFLEKAAGPIPVAKYNANAPKAAVDAIHTAIKSFQNKTALTLPKDIEVEFLEAKNSGEAYKLAIAMFNMFIGRALFIPDLLGFQGDETGGGSYSLGQDQINVFFKHVQRRRETLERIVNLEIIKPIVLFNFGDMEKFPKFKLRPIQDNEAAELAKLWLEAVKGKVYKPGEEEVNHFRKLCKFPEGPVEFVEPVQIDPETGKPMPPKPPGAPGEEGKEGEKPEGKEAPEKEEEAAPPKEFAFKGKALHPHERKVDFKAIETAMDRFKNRVMDQAKPVVKRIMDDLGKQIERKRIIETGNAEKIGTLNAKYLGELRAILKKQFREAHAEGYLMGQRELMKGVYRNPLPDAKFLEFIESEAGLFADDWAASLTKRAKVEILAAIRDGKPLSQVLDALDLFGAEDASVSIERFARTKFTDIMNRGRLEFFNESGVVAAYRYSAILDDRTSDICEGLHGKVFKAGEEPVPPMHFNCRSLLVPITKFEEWEADDKVGSKDIDKFIEDNIGDGFSRYSFKPSQEGEEKPRKEKPEAKPEVEGLDFEVSYPDPVTEVYTYHRDGKAVRKIEIRYHEGTRKLASKRDLPL